MYDTQAFAPSYKPTVPDTGAGGYAGSLQNSVTVAASTVAAASARIPFGGEQIQIANTSTAWAFVNFGVLGAVVAATAAASYPVAPGTVVVVTVDTEVSGASVILATGTGDVIFTRGRGR